MNKITFLHGAETRRLRKIVQRNRDKALSRRANAVLLVLQGKARVEVAAALQAARSSVNRWLRWYEAAGIDGLKSQRTGRPQLLPKAFIVDVLKLLIEHRPRDIGYQRSRWSTELLSVVLKRLTGLKVHSSTIRRLLPQIGIVWRRSAPTLRIKDPAKAEKLAAIYEALNNCSAEHPVFYEDEVDIHLNPKIGADWGYKGKQRLVVTPGKNRKHYLAGALHSKTGQITYVGSTSKSSELFISLMEKLKRQYRRAKTITLVVDNYIIHKSKKTEKWLRNNPKFVLLFQPVYSPWVNKIEKLWHALHETITRNHCCKTMDDLLEQVEHFMDNVAPFPGGGHGLQRV